MRVWYNGAVTLLPPGSLDKVLRAQNPWWLTGSPVTRGAAARPRALDALLDATDDGSAGESPARSILLEGPRRSGKSAALRRLVDRRSRDVGYVDLEHALLRLEPLGPLVDRLLKLMQPQGRPWVLLDGLQALPDWPARFAELLETRPQAHFVATSSVSSGETAELYDTVRVPPLRFREVCEMRGLPDLGAPPLDPIQLAMPEQSDSADDYLFNRVLEPLLADYLVRGGFPDAMVLTDPAEGRANVRSGVVASAVYQDLPAVVSVGTQADVERVLLATLLHGTGPVHVEAFSDALGLDSKTFGRYVEHLERAFLVTSLRNYAASTERSRPRLFPTDPALPNSYLERGAEVLADIEARRELLVSAVVSHLADYAEARGFDLAYFREGDLSADVILVTPEGALPIVLVDREEVGEEEAGRVDRLMKRTGSRRAILLSRARPRRREALTFFESVDHLPAAYFLYALA